MVYLRRWLHGPTSHTTRQRAQSPASELAASKLATPIARRNENAGQSAADAVDERKNFSVLSQATDWSYQLHLASLEAGVIH